MIHRLPWLLSLLGLLSSVALTPTSASTPRFPNLQPLPASDLSVELTSDGRRLLRFSTTSKNVGLGPVELVAGEVTGGGSTQRVYQRIFVDLGPPLLVNAGDFMYHPAHQHFHFEDYATYVLQPVNASGSSQRTGSKVTFCVMDTTRIDVKLPGAPKQAYYRTCGAQVQGMSVGWGDTYGAHLDGQEIDITGLPDGTYNLVIEIDPRNRLQETNDGDNVSTVQLRLTGSTVCVVGSRRCA